MEPEVPVHTPAAAEPEPAQTEATLPQLLDRIIRMPARETITFREFFELFGEQSIYVMVLAISLPVAIPYFSLSIFMALMGLPLTVIGISMVLGAHRMWLPKWVAGKSFSYPKAIRVLKLFNTTLDYLERYLRPRLPQLVSGMGERLAGAVLVVLSVSLFFADDTVYNKNWGPTAVFLIALALIMRDGWLMLGALVLSALCFILV